MALPNPIAALTRGGNGEPPADETEHPDWPAGWSDPTGRFWVKPELRPYYDRSPEAERRREFEINSLRTEYMIANHPNGRLDPDGTPEIESHGIDRANEHDHQDLLHGLALRDADTALFQQTSSAQWEATDLARWTCPACGRHSPPNIMGQKSMTHRALADGRVTKICSKCFAIATGLVRAQFEREQVEGGSRLDAVRAYLDHLPGRP